MRDRNRRRATRLPPPHARRGTAHTHRRRRRRSRSFTSCGKRPAASAQRSAPSSAASRASCSSCQSPRRPPRACPLTGSCVSGRSGRGASRHGIDAHGTGGRGRASAARWGVVARRVRVATVATLALGCNTLRWVATRNIGAATRPQVTVEAHRKEVRARKRLHNELIELKGNIRVICRVRPVRYPRRASVVSHAVMVRRLRALLLRGLRDGAPPRPTSLPSPRLPGGGAVVLMAWSAACRCGRAPLSREGSSAHRIDRTDRIV
jgi:hypothetical protein